MEDGSRKRHECINHVVRIDLDYTEGVDRAVGGEITKRKEKCHFWSARTPEIGSKVSFLAEQQRRAARKQGTYRFVRCVRPLN